MNTKLLLFVIATMFLTLSACSEQVPEVEDFYLPQGDSARGQQVFVDFKCYQCHTIKDTDLPEPALAAPFVVELGGKVRKVENYGQLLTAVIYPDHALSKKYRAELEAAGKTPGLSPMTNFTSEMTVTELIDLVEFLHGHYTRLLPQHFRGRFRELP
jgi:L-cysteine S-thiosulfotransferase